MRLEICIMTSGNECAVFKFNHESTYTFVWNVVVRQGRNLSFFILCEKILKVN